MLVHSFAPTQSYNGQTPGNVLELPQQPLPPRCLSDLNLWCLTSGPATTCSCPWPAQSHGGLAPPRPPTPTPVPPVPECAPAQVPAPVRSPRGRLRPAHRPPAPGSPAGRLHSHLRQLHKCSPGSLCLALFFITRFLRFLLFFFFRFSPILVSHPCARSFLTSLLFAPYQSLLVHFIFSFPHFSPRKGSLLYFTLFCFISHFQHILYISLVL